MKKKILLFPIVTTLFVLFNSNTFASGLSKKLKHPASSDRIRLMADSMIAVREFRDSPRDLFRKYQELHAGLETVDANRFLGTLDTNLKYLTSQRQVERHIKIYKVHNLDLLTPHGDFYLVKYTHFGEFLTDQKMFTCFYLCSGKTGASLKSRFIKLGQLNYLSDGTKTFVADRGTLGLTKSSATGASLETALKAHARQTAEKVRTVYKEFGEGLFRDHINGKDWKWLSKEEKWVEALPHELVSTAKKTGK